MHEQIRKTFHDLNNTLGAVILNLEVALDAEPAAGLTRESVQEALQAARELRDKIPVLRQQVMAAGGVK